MSSLFPHNPAFLQESIRNNIWWSRYKLSLDTWHQISVPNEWVNVPMEKPFIRGWLYLSLINKWYWNLLGFCQRKWGERGGRWRTLTPLKCSHFQLPFLFAFLLRCHVNDVEDDRVVDNDGGDDNGGSASRRRCIHWWEVSRGGAGRHGSLLSYPRPSPASHPTSPSPTSPASHPTPPSPTSYPHPSPASLTSHPTSQNVCCAVCVFKCLYECFASYRMYNYVHRM